MIQFSGISFFIRTTSHPFISGSTVYMIFALDVFLTVTVWALDWHVLVSGWGIFSAFTFPGWTFFAIPIGTGLRK